MKLVGRTTLMLTTAMLLASASIHALEDKLASAGNEAACHSLMTERECAAFRSTLATLPKGKDWDQFMARHSALMREREFLCNCSRANADTVILYPRVRQVAQRS